MSTWSHQIDHYKGSGVCGTITTIGIDRIAARYWYVESNYDALMTMKHTSYPLPTVSAIRKIPLNGLKVVSTFSGGGGTCLGLRLAGYEVVWANDCDPHARETYTANLGMPIDGRLLPDVTATDILSETGLKEGDLDLFEGSPPCTKFSTAGKRHKGWRQKERHAGSVQVNTEDLFFEWLRLARGLRPKVFVAENVAGLAMGVAKGYFKDILKEMKSLGYQVTARLLDAQWLGVPQRRRRIIFIGVRDDLERLPVFPTPFSRRWTVRQAIGDLLTSSSFTLKNQPSTFDGSPDSPAATIAASDSSGSEKSWRRNMIEVRGEMSGHIQMSSPRNRRKHSLDDPAPTVQAAGLDNSNMTTQHTLEVDFNDGYKSAQIKIDAFGNPSLQSFDKSSPCIMATSSSRFNPTIEAEQTVRRHLTIQEVKRLCSFPDDYILSGSFSRQWARLGNAVPPMMAYHIGRAIRTGIFRRGVGGRPL